MGSPSFRDFQIQAENPAVKPDAVPAQPSRLQQEGNPLPSDNTKKVTPGDRKATTGDSSPAPAGADKQTALTPEARLEKLTEEKNRVRSLVEEIKAPLKQAKQLLSQGYDAAAPKYEEAIKIADAKVNPNQVYQERVTIHKYVEGLKQQIEKTDKKDPIQAQLLKEYKEALQLDANLYDLQRAPSFTRANKGMAMMRNGKVEEGYKEVTNAATLDPFMKDNADFKKNYNELLTEIQAKGQKTTTSDQTKQTTTTSDNTVTTPTDKVTLPSGNNRPGTANFDDPLKHNATVDNAMVLANALDGLKGKADTDKIKCDDGKGGSVEITVAESRAGMLKTAQEMKIPAGTPEETSAKLRQLAGSEINAALKAADTMDRKWLTEQAQQLKTQKDAITADIGKTAGTLSAESKTKLATLDEQYKAATTPEQQATVRAQQLAVLYPGDTKKQQGIDAFLTQSGPALQQMSALYDSSALVRMQLGQTLLKNGEKEIAAKLLQEVPKLNPEYLKNTQYMELARAAGINPTAPATPADANAGKTNPATPADANAGKTNPATPADANAGKTNPAAAGDANTDPKTRAVVSDSNAGKVTDNTLQRPTASLPENASYMTPEQLLDKAQQELKTTGIDGAKPYFEAAIKAADAGVADPTQTQKAIGNLQQVLKTGKKLDGTDLSDQERLQAHGIMGQAMDGMMTPIKLRLQYADALQTAKQFATAENQYKEAIALADKLPIDAMKQEVQQIQTDLSSNTLDRSAKSSLFKVSTILQGQDADSGYMNMPLILRKDLAVMYLGLNEKGEVGSTMYKPKECMELINETMTKEKQLLGIDLDKEPGKDPKLMQIALLALSKAPEELKKQSKQLHGYWDNIKEDTAAGIGGMLVATGAALLMKNGKLGALLAEGGELTNLGRGAVLLAGAGGGTLTRSLAHRAGTGEWENLTTSAVHGTAATATLASLIHGGEAIGNKVFGLGAEGAGIEAQVSRLTGGNNGLGLKTLGAMNSLGVEQGMLARTASGVRGTAQLNTLGTLATDGVKLAGVDANVAQLTTKLGEFKTALQAGGTAVEPTANLSTLLPAADATALAKNGINTVEQLNGAISRVEGTMSAMEGINNSAKLGDIVNIFGNTGADRVSVMSKVLGGYDGALNTLATEGTRLAGPGATVESLAGKVDTFKSALMSHAGTLEKTTKLTEILSVEEATALAQRGIKTVEQLEESLKTAEKAMQTLQGMDGAALVGNRPITMSQVMGAKARTTFDFMRSPIQSTRQSAGNLFSNVRPGSVDFATTNVSRLNWTRNWQGYGAALAATEAYELPTTFYDHSGAINPQTGKAYTLGENFKQGVLMPLGTAIPLSLATRGGNIPMRAFQGEGVWGAAGDVITGKSHVIGAMNSWGSSGGLLGLRPLAYYSLVNNGTGLVGGYNRNQEANKLDELIRKTQAPVSDQVPNGK